MLAAYPTKTLDASLYSAIIYGSEDGVLNRKKLEEADRYLPEGGEQYVIEGGNHAQFGSYGIQTGDGVATISSEMQQRKTVEFIMKMLQRR
jgi:hypothetical protein